MWPTAERSARRSHRGRAGRHSGGLARPARAGRGGRTQSARCRALARALSAGRALPRRPGDPGRRRPWLRRAARARLRDRGGGARRPAALTYDPWVSFLVRLAVSWAANAVVLGLVAAVFSGV